MAIDVAIAGGGLVAKESRPGKGGKALSVATKNARENYIYACQGYLFFNREGKGGRKLPWEKRESGKKGLNGNYMGEEIYV